VDVLVAALAADCDAHAGPDHVERRLRTSERMLRLAQDGGLVAGEFLARRLRVVALLESGRLREADAEIGHFARLAAQVRSDFFGWYVPLWRGMQALLAGDLEVAFAKADEAATVGRRAESGNSVLLSRSLWFDASIAAGDRPADVREFVEEFRRQFAAWPQARVALALGFLLVGDDRPARSTLAGIRDPGRGDVYLLSRDSEWLGCMWVVGECALRLDDREAARWTYGRLAPYADLWVIDGIGASMVGVVHHQLGQLAKVLGRAEDAQRHLLRAEKVYVDAGAALLLAQVRELLDGSPNGSPTDTESNSAEMIRQDQLWTLHWRGVTVTVRDTRGMADLATLLGRPGVPVPALELMAAGGQAVVEHDLGFVFDARARHEFRRRYLQIGEEISDAEPAGSRALLDRLLDERRALATALGEAYGLGGRPRLAKDPAERARKAVARRIGTAIDAIERGHPSLARHLRLAVRTGRVCRYDPEEPVDWTVRA
jgi:hypothetical protein